MERREEMEKREREMGGWKMRLMKRRERRKRRRRRRRREGYFDERRFGRGERKRRMNVVLVHL